MIEKYGFVYLWRDRKYRRFYIGCHWGSETDGYICSSDWMRSAYRRRKGDFKRRIVARIYTSRSDLLEEEHRWLSMIKDEKLGKRYYNISKKHFSHWSTDEAKAIIVNEKLKQSWTNERRKRVSETSKPWTAERRQIAAETLSKTIKKLNNDPDYKKRRSTHMRALQAKQWADPEHRAKISQKASAQMKKQWADPEFRQVNAVRLKDAHNTEAAPRNRSQRARTMWANPELKSKMLEALHTSSQKRSKSIKAAWSNPDFREKRSQQAKKLWENPEYRAMCLRPLEEARKGGHAPCN